MEGYVGSTINWCIYYMLCGMSSILFYSHWFKKLESGIYFRRGLSE